MLTNVVLTIVVRRIVVPTIVVLTIVELTKAAIIDSMTRTQHNRTRHSTNDFQLLMKNDICFHERSFLFDGLMGEQALLLEPWSSLTGV